MTKINKSKDGRIGPEPKAAEVKAPEKAELPSTEVEKPSSKTVRPRSAKKGITTPKARKNFQPTMKAKKTKK